MFIVYVGVNARSWSRECDVVRVCPQNPVPRLIKRLQKQMSMTQLRGCCLYGCIAVGEETLEDDQVCALWRAKATYLLLHPQKMASEFYELVRI